MLRHCIIVILSLVSFAAVADGSAIRTIQLPYVQPLEKEFEYWSVIYGSDKDTLPPDIHHVSFGQAVSEKLFLELEYFTGNNDAQGVEIEAIYQLSEQGEYDSDWGLYFEYERNFHEQEHELALGVLNTFSWSEWQITTNLNLIYENSREQSEIETQLALQSKYRLSAEFEPGMELYVGQDSIAIGPMMTGRFKLPQASSLVWLFSILRVEENNHRDNALKLQIEYEFY